MTGFASKRKMSLSRTSDEYWGLDRARGWKLKLCWTPKRCFLSEKPLWGKRAYHGVLTITGPGDPVFKDFWIDKNEFIIWNLKGR